MFSRIGMVALMTLGLINAPLYGKSKASQGEGQRPALHFMLRKELPFRLFPGNRIVVEGSVGGGHELSMLVDTGSAGSVVDKRIVERLGFPTLDATAEYIAGTQSGKAVVALVSDLTLGPIRTSLHCLVADLAGLNIGAIVGLNVLRGHNFMIDYAAQKIRFSPTDTLKSSARFDPDANLVVILAKVKDQEVRFLVDSGAAVSMLYESGPRIWSIRTPRDKQYRITFMAGNTHAAMVPLKTLRIGSTIFSGLSALILKDPKSQTWDAILGIGSLGLSRIQFDFERGLLSWERDH